MTDNEIIKALPKVLYGGHGCKNCKYDNGKGDDRCGLKGCKIARYALDLINRQRADIENYKQIAENQQSVTLAKSFQIKELKIEIERLSDLLKRHQRHTNRIRMISTETVKRIKSEAYKEFAERLKKEFSQCQREYRNVLNSDGACAMIIAKKVVDNILKELVGEDGPSGSSVPTLGTKVGEDGRDVELPQSRLRRDSSLGEGADE